jgi:hypothetical protein
MNTNQNGITDSDKPPFFKRWRSLYWLVIAALVFEIVLFYGITRYFE